jgi:hypothetical protein
MKKMYNNIILSSILIVTACTVEQKIDLNHDDVVKTTPPLTTSSTQSSKQGHSPFLLPQDMIGIWQASSTMAAGWDTLYQFFASNTYHYRTSQMQTALRDRGHSGRWKIDDGTVIISPIEQYSIVEGTIIDNDPIYGKTIIGGTLKTKKSASMPQTLNITKCAKPEVKHMKCLTIDGTDFYKFSSDPMYEDASDLDKEPIFE